MTSCRYVPLKFQILIRTRHKSRRISQPYFSLLTKIHNPGKISQANITNLASGLPSPWASIFVMHQIFPYANNHHTTIMHLLSHHQHPTNHRGPQIFCPSSPPPPSPKVLRPTRPSRILGTSPGARTPNLVFVHLFLFSSYSRKPRLVNACHAPLTCPSRVSQSHTTHRRKCGLMAMRTQICGSEGSRGRFRIDSGLYRCSRSSRWHCSVA